MSATASRTKVVRSSDAMIETPTGLKPVLDVIPEHCYERSTARGLFLFGRDVVIFGLAVWGLLSTNNPLLLVPLWLLAGISVAGLFVIGHDAAHDALFDSKRLNGVVARLSMLPSLHAVEVWVFGHNRVHHGHTLKQGLDFVWHPLTVEQYEELGPPRQAAPQARVGPVRRRRLLPARGVVEQDGALHAAGTVGEADASRPGAGRRLRPRRPRRARRARRCRRDLAVGEGRRGAVPAVLPDDRLGGARAPHRTRDPLVATPRVEPVPRPGRGHHDPVGATGLGLLLPLDHGASPPPRRHEGARATGSPKRPGRSPRRSPTRSTSARSGCATTSPRPRPASSTTSKPAPGTPTPPDHCIDAAGRSPRHGAALRLSALRALVSSTRCGCSL